MVHTYLDFSHADLAHAHFPSLKKCMSQGLGVSSDLRSVLARIEIVVILVHYQPSYNTSHTMKPSDPLLLADVLWDIC